MSTLQFSNRARQLDSPYAPPQTALPPRLDLRDVVPDFSELYPQNIGPYPKTAPLAAAIAEEMGVNASQVAITAGGDDALFQIIMAVMEPKKNLVVSTPTFPMFQRYVTIAGGEMRAVPWLDGDFPIDKFMWRIDRQTSLVLFVSPNTPSGQTVPFEVMKSARAAVPDALLVLDAVYIEYADRDITQEFLNLPNTLVVRSFSKAYGAAGLRLGYAISKNSDVLLAMRKIAQPYSVSAPSIEMGLQLLQQKPQIMTVVEKIKSNRAILQNELVRIGWQFLASQANFIFINCGDADAARTLFEQMDARGIAIRYFPKDPLIASYVRIGVPCRDEDLEFLISTLTEIKR